MPSAYADLIGSPLEGLIDPRELRKKSKSDGALHAARRQPPPPPARNIRGLNTWEIHALEVLDAPLRGSGKNGAWTKADFDGLVAT